MILTIFLVALGQTYWLYRLYDDEFNNLKKGMDAQFRNSFYQLQRSRFLKDSMLFTQIVDTIYSEKETISTKPVKKEKPNILLQVDGRYFKDSNATNEINKIRPEDIRSISIVKTKNDFALPPELMETLILRTRKADTADEKTKDAAADSINLFVKGIAIRIFKDSAPNKERLFLGIPVENQETPVKKTSKTFRSIPVIRMSTNNKTLNDSIPLSEVNAYFSQTLQDHQKQLAYRIIRQQWEQNKSPKTDQARDTLRGFITSIQLSGIKKPFSYQVIFPDTRKFLFKQMGGQIAGSLFMVMVLVIAFAFIIHSVRRQQRLADIKNEFISNITHELKTPISTVHVALEALQNFNAIDDPKRSKEYIDISMSELTRLELLVDNVLKRTMMEKDAIKMDQSTIDLHQVIQSVLLTLKVQFEKSEASVEIKTEGDNFFIRGDRLHMTSVIYNLLDNAIKYSEGKPDIDICLVRKNNIISLAIADRGIGIAKTHHDKIFQPFFRVPQRDRHNAKGHGLGLSYVAHIIKQHHGTIGVADRTEKGTVFTIQLPAA